MAKGVRRYEDRTEFARFIEIARGSLVETHNHVREAYDRHYLAESEFKDLTLLANRSIGAVTNFLRYLRSRREPRTSTKNPEP